ncbi:hypothetical protein N7G274_003495 [Stereocaulon virgatum]|uniref:Aspartokinase n=1 Tax=Stereocaulon virgatum TaxID=373712 RepID=A0ABR4AEV0_9LECA
MTVESLPNGVAEHSSFEKHAEKLLAQRVVLKFGGTSIGKFASQIADICLSSLSENKIAVICSARSGLSKAEGTTNRLLKASREAAKPDSTKCDAIVSQILHEHISAVHFKSTELSQRLQRAMTTECRKLSNMLATMPKNGQVSPENEDEVVSVGEKLSAQFLSMLLEDYGVDSEYVDLSDIIHFEVLSGLNQDFYQDLAQAIGRRIQLCGEKVPVITGFFGRVPGGLLKNCGRGYSDLCAALVAVGLGAQELQVWKEVSGVYTADPRKVPTARLLSSIHPNEANELTFYGSEVIHHFTIEQCIPKIPIRIKNVLEPEGAGTIIFLDDRAKTDPYHHQRPKRPTAVTVKQQITVVNVHSHRKVESPEFLAEICKILARWSLAVNLFELNECHVSLAVHSKTPFIKGAEAQDPDDLQIQHQDLANAIQELKEYGAVDVVHNMAILSLIGLQLKRSIGIAGRMFTALGDNNINIEMISQGASEINISCVIAEREALRALNVVHTDLFTFLE